MLTGADWSQMAADLAAVRGDREETITIRRGGSTLDPQVVRIARAGGGGREMESAGGQESRGRVVVLGSATLDIRPGDRFNDSNGTLYRVIFVRPNRRAAVIAEAEVIE